MKPSDSLSEPEFQRPVALLRYFSRYARSDNAVVRKQATSVLSQSKDPRAVAFMEAILKK